jgi:hypothetical protein
MPHIPNQPLVGQGNTETAHGIDKRLQHLWLQIVYEDIRLNETHPSQGTTLARLSAPLIILACAQRDLQEIRWDRLPPENLLTKSAELISWLQSHGPSWCMNGLAAPFELYCVERVKATQSSLEEEFTYNNGRILYMESHVQEIAGTKKGSSESFCSPD